MLSIAFSQHSTSQKHHFGHVISGWWTPDNDRIWTGYCGHLLIALEPLHEQLMLSLTYTGRKIHTCSPCMCTGTRGQRSHAHLARFPHDFQAGSTRVGDLFLTSHPTHQDILQGRLITRTRAPSYKVPRAPPLRTTLAMD